MVQIGTIEYEAKVSNVAQAQSNAADLTESQREMGEQATETAGATAFLGTVLGTTAEQEEDVKDEAEQTDEQFTLLAGTTWLLTGALSRLVGVIAGGGIFSTLIGGAKRLIGWLAGLTLSGVAGRIAGAWKWLKGIVFGFFSRLFYWAGAVVGALEWLVAQGGALAAAGYGIAAAIGAVIGLFGVWILEITGVLDWIGKLGEMLGNALPAWARDGITAIIGLFAGPLAVIGSFIVGFIRGGFDKAFELAGKTIDIFFGAFRRTFDRIAGVVAGVANWIGTKFGQAWSWVKGQLAGFKNFVFRIFGRVEDAIAGATSWLETKWQDGVRFVRGIIQGFKKTVDRIFGTIEDFARDPAQGMRDAWSWAKNKVVGFIKTIRDWANRILGTLEDVIDRAGEAADTVRNVSPVGAPGGSGGEGLVDWGGFPVDVPVLQSGGTIQSGGIARVHKGEAVIPRPIVEAAMSGGGGGGGNVHVDTVNVELSGDFDPSNVSRRDLERLADRITEAVGAKTNRRSGVR